MHPSNIQQYITTKYEHLSNKRLPIIPKIDYNKFFNTQDNQKNMDDYLRLESAIMHKKDISEGSILYYRINFFFKT